MCRSCLIINLACAYIPFLGDNLTKKIIVMVFKGIEYLKKYVDNEMYEEYVSVSGYICNRLFSIDEDSFAIRRMTRFCKLFGRY